MNKILVLSAFLILSAQTAVFASDHEVQYGQLINGKNTPHSIPTHFAVRVLYQIFSSAETEEDKQVLLNHFRGVEESLTAKDVEKLVKHSRRELKKAESKFNNKRVELMCKTHIDHTSVFKSLRDLKRSDQGTFEDEAKNLTKKLGSALSEKVDRIIANQIKPNARYHRFSSEEYYSASGKDPLLDAIRMCQT